MNPPGVRFVLLALIALFLLQHPVFVHASPPPADSLHLRAPFDYEPVVPPEPPGAAAKPLANLEPGEPRTVYLIYRLPDDRPFRPEVVQRIKDDIIFVQAFFGEQLEAHGFGYKTFRVATDDEGEPLVHLRGVAGAEQTELDLSKNILVTVVDNGTGLIGGVAGMATWSSKQSGSVEVPSEFSRQTLAHELGHAFGMGHDFRDETHIMSYGLDQRRVLSACAARFLAVHPYFNPDVGVEWAEAPTVELLSDPFYPAGSESVPIRLALSDAHGLHLLRLRVQTRETHDPRLGRGWELKLCRGFFGEEEAEVEIEYDGVIPSGSDWGFSDLSDPKVHPIAVIVMDRDANRTALGFDLWEVSRQHLATFELAEEVHAVTFAPDGRLVAGSKEGVELWDLETGTGTATSLSGAAAAVALSPDGAMLASVSGTEVQLLDMAGGQVTGTLSEHTHPIRSLAFSPVGAMLATGAEDGIRVWDLETQSATATLPVDATAVAFSPDGTRLVSGSGHVQLWDLATQTEVATYPHSRISAVAFSPDGTRVASGGDGATVRLWNVATGENLGGLQGQGYYTPPPVTSVAFSPDGTLLAFGATFETHQSLGVHVWDPVTKGRLATLQGEGKGVNTVAFSRDGTTLAAGTQDGKIDLWDLSEWRQPRPQTLMKISGDGQQGTAGSALANPLVVEVRDQYGNPLQEVQVTFSVTAGDGTLGGRFTIEKATTDAHGRAETLLTLGPDPETNTVEAAVPGLDLVAFSAVGAGTPATPAMEGDLHTWHLPPGAIARLGKGRIGRGDRGVAFSPDGRLLAVGTHIGVWLYEVATSREVALLPTRHEVFSIAFSPDGKNLASGEFLGPANPDGMVRLWDLATGTTIAAFDSVVVNVAVHTSPSSLGFSPDGKTLAVSSANGVKLLDVGTQSKLAAYDHRGTGWGAGAIVSFSPDGTILASGADDGTIRLWDVSTGTLSATLEEHTDEVRSLSFSPDGTILASASLDHTVRLWDMATGANTATFEGHTDWVFSVAFSPDGRTVASGSGDDTIRLWNVATGENTATFEGHTEWVFSVAFSPDGATLASGSLDGTVKLWEVATGNAGIVGWHMDMIWSMALSPDGTTLAAGYGFGTIWLWDVRTGTNTALKGHSHRINSLLFSSDGTILVSGSSDGTVRLWDVEKKAAIATLETDGNRNRVSSVALSPDGRTIASGHADGTARLWDVATGAHTATLAGHTYAVGPLVFSPDGATLASGDSEIITPGSSYPKIRLWDVATGTRTATFDLDTDWLVSISFSTEMTPIAMGGTWDLTAELWDLANATRIAEIPWESSHGFIWSGALSPDGSVFVFGSTHFNRPSVVIWDFGAKTRTTLYGHGDLVDFVRFSSEGTVMASGSRDFTILVWDIQGILPHPIQVVLPHPRTLAKLWGDKQEVPAGAALPEPLVVTVLDQNGDPFPGATVTFAVTAGGGTLSTTNAVTDVNGLAATTLTLGSDPGRNTVTAKVADLKPVIFGATGQAIPRTLAKVSGDEQEGPAGTGLVQPFVVSVLDQNGDPFAGATVTFAVTAGGGTLSATTATTDADGRASAILTLGSAPGANTVTAAAAGLDPVTFTAAAEVSTDFDGDTVTGLSDFFLFADAFGGSDPRFDLDGDGSVGFGDFFLLADRFAEPERGKLLALAREMIGLPDGPQLQQNAPNPFNSGTVISWFLLRPGPARVEVFSLTGQRVAVLREGPEKAGVHRVRWDGRDDRGRPLASGVYLYRLATEESVQTRKLTLLR